MPISTTSTKGMYSAIETRLLTFVPMGGGATLTARLAGRLYTLAPPDTAAFPYGVLTLGPRFSDGRDQSEREQFEATFQLFHRPRSKLWELEEAADVSDQAMLRWRETSGGFIGCKGTVRQLIPQPPANAPTDREIIQILTRYSMFAWPQFRTQYNAA